jgi:thiol-disulfide isomerase/thioredoxin
VLRAQAWLALIAGALALGSCAPGSPSRATGGAHAGAPSSSAAPVLTDITAAQLKALAARPGAKATLVNVWATWCGPCREEFPALVRVIARHPETRFVLVSTDFTEQRGAALEFLQRHGITDSTYFKHESDSAFIDGLDPRWTGSLPATLVYDAGGRAVAFWEGAAESTRFEAALAKAIAATP